LYESVADRTFMTDGSSIRKVAREVAQWHRDALEKAES